MDALRRFTYGRHILAKVEQLLAAQELAEPSPAAPPAAEGEAAGGDGGSEGQGEAPLVAAAAGQTQPQQPEE